MTLSKRNTHEKKETHEFGRLAAEEVNLITRPLAPVFAPKLRPYESFALDSRILNFPMRLVIVLSGSTE